MTELLPAPPRHEPPAGRRLPGDAQSRIPGQWRSATVEVIYAQIAYAEMVSQGTADEGAFDTAWLRLWKAQEHQRGLSWELDQIDNA